MDESVLAVAEVCFCRRLRGVEGWRSARRSGCAAGWAGGGVAGRGAAGGTGHQPCWGRRRGGVGARTRAVPRVGSRAAAASCRQGAVPPACAERMRSVRAGGGGGGGEFGLAPSGNGGETRARAPGRSRASLPPSLHCCLHRDRPEAARPKSTRGVREAAVSRLGLGGRLVGHGGGESRCLRRYGMGIPTHTHTPA